MKIDICEVNHIQKELCTDVKYCCKLMKSMIKQHYIDIDLYMGEAHCELSLDDDRNYMKMFPYEDRDKDIIQLNHKVNINYCPFCGENININERRGSPI